MGKRKKDKEFYDLHETLGDLYFLVEEYLKALEANLEAPESDESLRQEVKLKIDRAKELLDLIDGTVWPRLRRVAGYSCAISHRRVGGFF